MCARLFLSSAVKLSPSSTTMSLLVWCSKVPPLQLFLLVWSSKVKPLLYNCFFLPGLVKSSPSSITLSSCLVQLRQVPPLQLFLLVWSSKVKFLLYNCRLGLRLNGYVPLMAKISINQSNQFLLVWCSKIKPLLYNYVSSCLVQ
jgi:hypothetical protein